MKLSTRLCENNHNVTIGESYPQMPSIASSPVRLAGGRNVHRYQSVFQGERANTKRVMTVPNALNRWILYDSHTAELTAQTLGHRYQTVFYCECSPGNRLARI
jgi:hypothetical protein